MRIRSRPEVEVHGIWEQSRYLSDADIDPANDLHQFIVGTAGAPFSADSYPYNGDNSGWTPLRVLREQQYGYVIVEIDGYRATATWHHRTGYNSYEATADVFTYDAWPVIRATWSNGQLVLNWFGTATLQWAFELMGAFADLPEAISPCVITNFDGGAQFYRLRVP